MRKIPHPNSLITIERIKSPKAFTLVELIIVVTILSILASIWFVSYNWHTVTVRDTNRISQLAAIHDWLEVYRTRNDLPLPENSVEVRSSAIVIWTQWYMWKNNLELIAYNKWWIDPKDGTYFSYYVTKDRKYFQLMWFLEDQANKQTVRIDNSEKWIVNNEKGLSFSVIPAETGVYKNIVNPLIPATYAADYTNRFPTVYWKKLGILTDINNNPIQEVPSIKTATFVELTTDAGTYKANFTDRDSITGSWYAIQSMMISRQSLWQPTYCPDWFIPVPGNIEFNQNWFCVAKYEMTYSDATTPDSCNTPYPSACTANQDWNTMRYQAWKTIVSMPWKYPITNITQQQAIDACKSMWEWYHLITNNEWMTIARSIESNPDNWSGKQLWVWNLYNGVSNNTTLWCNATWWNTETRTYATKTWPWTDSTCNTKRKHTLSNWQEIWDLSWNVWEHVNKANTIDWTNYNNWQITVAWSSGWVAWDNDWIYAQADMKKYGSSLYLWTAYWLWNLYYANWVVSNIFLRGASADTGSSAGVFTLVLDWTSGLQGRGAGFRCTK